MNLPNSLAIFYPQGHAAHFLRGHPERPDRVEAIRSALESNGVWDQSLQISASNPSETVLSTVHDPAYLSLLERAARRGGGFLDSDTYVTAHSWDLALQAAGGTVELVRAVWRKDSCLRGFAMARPPGHHATHGQGMGFCLLNNIAVAAESLIQEEGAHRLAIIDLDLHHGNGTQDIFWRRSDVLYISTHQSPFYPFSGSSHEIGAGPGEGWTANIPLPPGSGDDAFKACMHSVILPLLVRFRPEMLMVSYGFDPHWRDPLGSLCLSAAGYGHLVAALRAFADEHCQGRIALVLEGGYDLEAAKACSQAVCASLLGHTFQDFLGPAPSLESEITRAYWQQSIEESRKALGL